MTCWVGIVGASGTGKTPGIDAVKRALAQLERDRPEQGRRFAAEA
jgi:ABC-type dipeptide/oligopeptide/nickel transport system ATPase subunit